MVACGNTTITTLVLFRTVLLCYTDLRSSGRSGPWPATLIAPPQSTQVLHALCYRSVNYQAVSYDSALHGSISFSEMKKINTYMMHSLTVHSTVAVPCNSWESMVGYGTQTGYEADWTARPGVSITTTALPYRGLPSCIL